MHLKYYNMFDIYKYHLILKNQGHCTKEWGVGTMMYLYHFLYCVCVCEGKILLL